ncbi:MAG: DUF2214 domain-containing protein [Caulobacter sp.]|nr:DUF2214 domain-containing protein [Caulobacter sp.]
MTIQATLSWLEATPLSLAIAESAWLFPTLEAIHVIGLTLVVGLIAVVDLRLLGVASLTWRAGDLNRTILPLTWSAFGLAALSGGLMFTGKPSSYLANPFFVGKLALLALAGLNMTLFHHFLSPRVEAVDGAVASSAVKTSAAASLVLWISIVALGRWIGFTI